MKERLKEHIGSLGVLPVAVAESSAEAVSLAEAIYEGGIDVIEITLRTKEALEAIRETSRRCPYMTVGAGTVLTLPQCEAAIEAGARFIVSPGLGEDIARFCEEKGILYVPGCATPTEIMKALSLGLDTVKFFPAKTLGGAPALKAISAAFPGVRYIPTGGVSEGDMALYLGMCSVLAVGGSWLCSKDKDKTRQLSAAAVRAARKAKGECI